MLTLIYNYYVMSKLKLFQTGTLKNLMLGDFNGSICVSEILKNGNLGIGTYDSFDGEAIFLNGHAYNGRADGKVYEMKSTDTCPFCQVASFDDSVIKKSIYFDSIGTLTTKLMNEIDSRNHFYAIKMQGIFNVTYRSCFKVEKPFKPLAIVAKEQKIFVKEQIEGTVVGIYSPEFSDGMSLPGWHLHFIDKDLLTGGHILKLQSEKCDYQINKINEWLINFSESDEFKTNDLLIDLKEATKIVEG